MPLPGAVRYRYKKGTKIRYAFDKAGNVIEIKNMETGEIVTKAELDRRGHNEAKNKARRKR
jgi:hypothetical protein